MQNELFPEQPPEVESLLKDIRRVFEQQNTLEQTYLASKDAFAYKSNSLSKRLREICVHPEIRIEHSHDYHNNTEWDSHICATCDKLLKRV